MNRIAMVCLSALLGGVHAASAGIVIEVQVEDENLLKELPPDMLEQGKTPKTGLFWSLADSVAIFSSPYAGGSLVDFFKEEGGMAMGQVTGNKIRWELPGHGQLSIHSPLTGQGIVEPGSTVTIVYKDGQPAFTGSGGKVFQWQRELAQMKESALRSAPTRIPLGTSTREQYLQWLKILDEHMGILLAKLESGKDIPAPGLFERIKMRSIESVEYDRLMAFVGLSSAISGKELCDLWDATQKETRWGVWLRSRNDYLADALYLYEYNRQSVRRNYEFDSLQGPLASAVLRKTAYYESARDNYQGLAREKLLQWIIPEQVIFELRHTSPATLQKILEDYYRLPGFPQNRQRMRDYFDALKPKPAS